MTASAFDLLIVGGGLSGLSAAIFTCRAGLKTVVFDKGESTIATVARVNNYLGFPEGIPGAELIERGRKQAQRFGAVVKMERVEHVRRLDDGSFEAETEAGAQYAAPRIMIASNKNTQAAADLGLPLGGFKGRFIHHDGRGRTSIKNAYVCGRITEIPSQSAISVGDGAAAALTLIQDLRGEYYVDHDD
jgi:thioredoxin reductase (NADPH)